MQPIRDAIAASCLVAFFMGCGGPPAPAPPPFKPVADVRTLMVDIIDPSSDVIWDSVGAIRDSGWDRGTDAAHR